MKNFKGKVKLLILSVVATLSIEFPTESDAIDVIIQVNEYQEQNPSTVVLGDLDGDGEVTPKDDLLFKEYFSGKSAEEPDCNVADIDRDGMLTRKDAMFLARYLAGWDGYLLEVVDITDKLPWEVSGSKQPKDYNWLEYQALTDAQQEAFFESFENVNDFELWMNKAQNELPWENDGKQPKDYNWIEYCALTDAQQEAFFESFEDVNDFKVWMDKAQTELPWENGGKQPKDYNWLEYQALTDVQQEAFFESFDDVNDFLNWWEDNHPQQ